ARPWLANHSPGIRSVRRIPYLAVFQSHERGVPNQIRHLAAQVVWHRFDIDRGLVRDDGIRATVARKADRCAMDRNNVAERSGVFLPESIQNRERLCTRSVGVDDDFRLTSSVVLREV